MKHIRLDASAWHDPADFYSCLFAELGSPEWHGRNFNALRDGLYGGINRVEAPFTVHIARSSELGPEMITFLLDVAEVFGSARDDYGVDVHIRLT